jgi:hypothetical protein
MPYLTVTANVDVGTGAGDIGNAVEEYVSTLNVLCALWDAHQLEQSLCIQV